MSDHPSWDITTDQTWRLQALCAQIGGSPEQDLWFVKKGGSTRKAKKVCLACPVRAECLDYALETKQRFGVWGGLTEHQRRPLEHQLQHDDDQWEAA